MKASINTPQHLEPQANYLQQDLPRGVESVREAESRTCARASVVDMLVSAVCPCVSVAQAASSLGSSYLGTLMGFAALNLVGLFNFLVLYYTIDRGYRIGFQDFGTFLGMELLMFMFGPVPSLFVAILFYYGVDGDISTTLEYIYIINVACDIIFALASQFLVRNKLRRRVGLPGDGIFRVLFSSLCCLWFNTATTATSAKKYTRVSSCHLGVLDAIPAYDPSERSVVDVEDQREKLWTMVAMSVQEMAPPPRDYEDELHTIDLKEDAMEVLKAPAKHSDDVDATQDERQHLASDTRTFANTIIAFLGSGVLGLPYAFRQCGILLGLATLIFVASISTYAMLLVVQCKYKLKERGITVKTYGEIGYQALGRVGTLLVDTALVISQAGFCVAYLIFISTNAHQFLNVSKELVISVCMPPLVAFSLLKHMKELAYAAFLADVMNFLGLTVVYMTDLSYMAMDTHHIEAIGVVSSMPFFFGVAIYCFEGVGMVLPLENGMENPHHFKAILVCTVVIITSIYATFGICGYLAFGDATLDVITLNMTDDGGVVTMVKLCLCAGLFFAYPLMLFPVFEILQPLVKGANEETTSEVRAVVLRCSMVLLTALMAIGIPNFGQFIAFIGSTCCAMLAFVLPASFHLVLFREERSYVRAAGLCVMICLGVAIVIHGVVHALTSIVG
ncbi:hypothetical protein Poli38472_009499 [Pythium oligandrum]|uniref:Amino acid transporter transmembrane domain-containing protein n=1 Tax=Pythium oligandrum TaxID=41045 RepID=A0A8K1CFQ4_PYTOL|nr:hypothetical protein Poli38472_009499 [Pythium oligandrum]|eukprot:TMW62006.1 hypothetical protein Poli38472_009499 [Pythium oligandrum]